MLIAASTIFTAHVSAAPELSHPRLYFAGQDLPELRKKVERPPLRYRWAGLRQFAEGCLNRRPPRAGAARSHSRTSLGVAGACAFAYAVTGERRYGLRAKRELLALLQTERWYRDWGWNRGADLSTGELGVASALVYDWCHDLFTPQERRQAAEAIFEHAVRPYLASIEQHHDWWVDNYVTNWCGVVHGGCGLAALAIAPEVPEARPAADYAWEHLQKFLRSVVLKDGGGHEGVMYWRYGVEFANYYATAAARLRGDDAGLFETYAEKLAGYWDNYMQGPDGRYANFNDMSERTYRGLWRRNPNNSEGGPRAALCALFEAQVPGGDRLLRWAADSGGDKFYWRGTSPFYFLWRRQAPPAGAKPELHDAVLFRGAGHAIFRSPRLWFAFNGGWTSDRSHSNRDLGTFVLLADGERFVSDPGYGAADTSDHSTVLVNGRGQPEDVRGRFRRFGQADGFKWVACDLSECYPDTPLRRWVRHAVMVDGRYLVLADDLRAERPAEFESRLQSRRPSSAGPGPSVVIEGAGTDLHVLAPSPQGAAVSARRRRVRHKGRDPWFHTVSVRPPGPTTEALVVTVLFPTPDGAPPPQARFERPGRLRVRGQGRDDALVFRRSEDGWTLGSVNGADAGAVGTGKQRVLEPFRPVGGHGE
ncbi:MAG: DUF4962 domain-containing protein [Planctomycetota bacterium]